jgi:hypothetical protein
MELRGMRVLGHRQSRVAAQASGDKAPEPLGTF